MLNEWLANGQPMASQWPGSQKKKKKRKTRKKRIRFDRSELSEVPTHLGPKRAGTPTLATYIYGLSRAGDPLNLVKYQRIWDPGARADPGAPAAARC